MLRINSETRHVLSRACEIVSAATGQPCAAVVEAVDANMLRRVSEALRLVSPVSPLADDIDAVLSAQAEE